jgi:hypothetical protein
MSPCHRPSQSAIGSSGTYSSCSQRVRGATRGGPGVRTGRCRPGGRRDGADAARARRAQARRSGIEQSGHRRAAGAERAHGPPAPGQHPPQARPVLARRGRGLGGAHRAGVSLARPGHLPRRCEAGPYGRSVSAAISHITGLVLTRAGLACGFRRQAKPLVGERDADHRSDHFAIARAWRRIQQQPAAAALQLTGPASGRELSSRCPETSSRCSGAPGGGA